MDSKIKGEALERPAWKDILYGSAAGMASKLFEHPFDLVKVRLQSQSWDSPTRFKGPIDCFVRTWRGEGIRGLYRGLTMPVGCAMAENATLFLAYNQTQRMLNRFFPYQHRQSYAPLSHLAISGAAAGAAASFVLTPIELVKCRMQVQMISPTFAAGQPLPGPVRIASDILRQNGLRGLWLGQTGTFLREAGGSAAWFLVFELAVRNFIKTRGPSANKSSLSVPELVISGAAAGVSYTVLLFPADTVKSTIQTSDDLAGQARAGFVDTGRTIYAKKGFRGLYQGCGVTAVRSAFGSGLIFSIYSLLEKEFG